MPDERRIAVSPRARLCAAMALVGMVAGCGQAQSNPAAAPSPRAADSSAESSLRPESTRRQAAGPPVTELVPVGDDPAASLAIVAAGVRAAIERFDKVEKLIYPRGWHRQRADVVAVDAEVVPAEGNQAVGRGVIRVTVQDRYSVIHSTRDEAAADEQLYPRRPFPSLDAMLNDRVNPPREPVELVLRYEIHDGSWRRVDWDGPDKTARGADWFDALGAP